MKTRSPPSKSGSGALTPTLESFFSPGWSYRPSPINRTVRFLVWLFYKFISPIDMWVCESWGLVRLSDRQAGPVTNLFLFCSFNAINVKSEIKQLKPKDTFLDNDLIIRLSSIFVRMLSTWTRWHIECYTVEAGYNEIPGIFKIPTLFAICVITKVLI